MAKNLPSMLAEPREFAAAIPSLPPEQLRMVMRENARQLVHPDGAAA